MFLRKHQLWALIAALGVLLHAGLAAAQVFCSMTGTLTVSCACTSGEGADGPQLHGADPCCRDALGAPSFDLTQLQQPLPGPALAAAWAQVDFEAPVLLSSSSAPAPAGTSPPLLGLRTIVLLH